MAASRTASSGVLSVGPDPVLQNRVNFDVILLNARRVPLHTT